METQLFKRGKQNEVRTVIIKTYSDKFEVWYGVLNGKLQVETTYPKSKNIGKTNETTVEQQVILESNSIVSKKIKSGYALTMETPSEVTLPAKVKTYQEQIKNIKFPCFSTPKLNGVNGLYKREGQTITLYSRGGEVYPEIPHLTRLINRTMDFLNCNTLNGELYIHGEHLQDIQSAVKKPNGLSPKLTFAIFDIPDCKGTYNERRDVLTTLTPNQYISVLTGVECNSHQDIETHYNQCILGNLEGTVVYNHDHLYIYNQRSSNAFKYKKALDAEFLIIGYELDKQGNPTLICQAQNGSDFKVRPTGTAEYRKQLLLDMPNNIGKYYKVEYEMLSKSLVPLKPIGLGIRECDNLGEPIE